MYVYLLLSWLQEPDTQVIGLNTVTLVEVVHFPFVIMCLKNLII